jgi:hypothetical protein
MRIFVVGACAVFAAMVCGAQAPTWGAGAAAGGLKFSDGATESAFGVTVSARFADLVDASINPTWGSATSARVGSVAGRTVSGFRDLPVSVGISRAMPGALSPSFGIALGVTLPTGDTAALGSGQTGVGASVFAGMLPSENLWVGAGAGRSLSNGYSAALASATSTSVALSAGTRTGPVLFSGSISGDVGPVEKGVLPARSIAGGIAIPIARGLSFTLDASAGLSEGSPSWAMSAGFGTAPVGIISAASAPYQRLGKAFGSGSKSKAKQPKG